MTKRRVTLKRIAISSLAIVQMTYMSVPTIAHAQSSGADAAASDGATTSTPERTTGIQAPTGAGSHTFVYNPETGLWANNYYTWSPITKQRTPRYDTSYNFNPATNMWEKVQWMYSPSAGIYKKAVIASSAVDPYAPAIEDTGPGSTNQVTNPNGNGAVISGTGPNSNNEIIDPVGDTSISNTGPNSNNQANTGSINQTGPNSNNIIGYDSQGNAIYDVNTNANLTNNLFSNATTGNALVTGNTQGGNASSGNAYADANFINMIQSAVGIGGIVPNLYTTNIYGDYAGDIVVDPGSLPNSNLTATCGCDSNLTINSTVDATIDNNVDLQVASGNAGVIGNTTGGDATSGDAYAVANIINMINSAITTGQSFIGVLNIYGDYEGDVLVADDILDQLIAANVPTSQICLCGDSTYTADIDNTQEINNEIATNASSGTATVSNNTTGGNASSGNAETSVTVFNLTGQNVIADNAMLVFVNVLGEWVGFITNAPADATAAAFGSGVSRLPAIANGGDTNIDIDNNFTINNNINIDAASGDATVSSNTLGGDATSGDAAAAANVVNITNSSFGVNNWLGMLFINIFGDWHGSFGTNTFFGDPIVPAFTGSGGSSAVASRSSNPSKAVSSNDGQVLAQVQVFHLTPSSDSSGSVVASAQPAPEAEQEESTHFSPLSQPAQVDTDSTFTSANNNMARALIAVGGGGLLILLGERLRTLLRKS